MEREFKKTRTTIAFWATVIIACLAQSYWVQLIFIGFAVLFFIVNYNLSKKIQKKNKKK